MIQRLSNLPSGIEGLSAEGRVTKEDYERVVQPLFEQARREGGRIRLLYHFGSDFSGMTPGAAWEDVRVGLQYLRLFQRCAIVTDIGWVRESSRLAGTLLPCPVKVFKNAEWQEAIGWLASTPAASVAPHRILPDSDVLVIEPAGPLGIEDFDAIELTVDSWMEGQGRPLRGIVVHSRAFPGWESIGGFFRHLRFLHDHQSRIHRIGIAADGRLAEFGPKLGNHLLEAEIRHFGYDAFDEALAWAAAAEAPSKREHAASAG